LFGRGHNEGKGDVRLSPPIFSLSLFLSGGGRVILGIIILHANGRDFWEGGEGDLAASIVKNTTNLDSDGGAAGSSHG
jgi:hypothetical protein